MEQILTIEEMLNFPIKRRESQIIIIIQYYQSSKLVIIKSMRKFVFLLSILLVV